MKKLLIACLLFTGWIQAQNITFKDPEFKKALINSSNSGSISFKTNTNSGFINSLDLNNDSEISIQEAQSVISMWINYNTSITSVDEIKYFINLELLYLEITSITSLDVTDLTSLKDLNCTYSNINSIDLSNNLLLENLSLYKSSKVSNIDLSKNTNLKAINFSRTNISTIDVSNNKLLVGISVSNVIKTLDLSGNPKMDSICLSSSVEYANLKNGSTLSRFWFDSMPPTNYLYICADNQNIPLIEQFNLSNIEVNSYCSFTPGGVYNTITSNVKYDLTGNCTGNDNFTLFTKFSIEDQNGKGTSVTNEQGVVNFFKQKGMYTLSPELENPNYFQVSPSLPNFNLIDNSGHDTTINFCITPNGIHNDLEIVLSPIGQARPGFDSYYQVTYKNKGNQTLSGDFTVEYNDNVLNLVGTSLSSISSGKLGKSFTDLKPFEISAIDTIVFKVNSPTDVPAVNQGDTLKFIATINPTQGDETPEDNIFKLNQIVVNSHDPNLITCLEGNELPSKEIGKMLHYTIEFENTGNYQAENIVVVETIDTTKYDISTLQILNTSHPMQLRLEGNRVEYYFQNIDLGEHKHGNILLKLYALESLKEGDTIKKQANIYFDYNAPVETNDEKTVYKDKLIQSLGLQGISLDETIIAFPNPSNGIFNLKAATQISTVEIYDLQGRVVQTILVNDLTHKIDLSAHDSGIFLLKVTTGTGANVLEIKKD